MAGVRLSSLVLAAAGLAFAAPAAFAGPAVPAVAKPAAQIRACNAEFRENAYTQGFAAARGLYSECLSSDTVDDVRADNELPKSQLRLVAAARADRVACHSFAVGGMSPARVCLTSAVAR